jgi:homoserine dehydrogenase
VRNPLTHNPLIVLKFGGSVLLDESRLRLAVHEIYRWKREGYRVVAVVSAFAGKTDDLLSRCDRFASREGALARAGVVATGELESAAFLGIHLDRAGIPASVITPGAASFLATGDPLDANPYSINAALLHEALQRDGVVVFPGFVALDDRSRAVVLGRGGSDLTALFLAHALGAHECRLIKDVDGLYEFDPQRASPPPRRFANASYEDALNTDGSIIQHKAVRFAQERGLSFTLARFNGSRPTVIGPAQSRFDDRRDTPRRLTVALLGAGVVGGGVLDHLAHLSDHFEVVGVSRRDPISTRALALGVPVTGDPVALASSGVDVVVEAIGGDEPARTAILAALESGAHVVSANKAVLAAHWREIHGAAQRAERRVLASASVGGSLPVLERCASGSVRSVRAVLNGTGNFVLERLATGASLGAAVSEAQLLGLAEADPSRDLDGHDALDKLVVVASTIGRAVEPAHVRRGTIGANALPQRGSRLRHVATLDERGARVLLEPVAPDDPLFDLPGESNAVVIERGDGSREVITGKGAGRWPTSESVVADLLELAREHALRADDITADVRAEVAHA